MTKRKFHRKLLTLEFLSEEPISSSLNIEEMIWEAKNGDYSMREIKEIDSLISGKRAAKLLMEQGSTPDFFRLDESGKDID